MSAEISRRGFITGAAALGGAAAASVMFSTRALAEEDAVKWDEEADVVIVGAGAAGLSAAVTTCYEGLGTAIVLEVANETEAGGNSRVCGQGVFCPKTVEAAVAYQTACNASYKVPEDLMQSWAENICENVDWMTKAVGFEAQEMGTAEFPEYDETGDVVWYAHQGKGPWAHTWQLFLDKCVELGVPIHYNSRATTLLRNEDGEICGVGTEGGKNYHALKGVILAAGGFENNQEMMDTYMEIGFPGYRAQGTPWNRGDGIKLAQSAGADLWHMNNVSGNGLELQVISPDDDKAISSVNFFESDFIFITQDGYRFMNEDATARHGKVYRAGTWCGRTMPEKCFVIMGQDTFDNMLTGSGGFYARTDGYDVAKSGQDLLDRGILTKCETVADIAALTGAPQEHIQETLDAYAGYAETGVDLDYHREVPFDEDNPAFVNTNVTQSASSGDGIDAVNPPYYVGRLFGSVLNTQGGPKRGAKGEVLDVNGDPIPRLFAAGEMGCIYAYLYNLGGNFSEAISSGRLAARSAGALEPLE